MVPEAHRPLGRLAEPPVRPGRLEVSGPFVLLWTTSSALVAHKDIMATSPCEGRAVALFDADAAAPCETSLAGIPLSARARVQTRCIEGDLAEVELMREDALASSRREGQPFETARPRPTDRSEGSRSLRFAREDSKSPGRSCFSSHPPHIDT